MIVSDSDAVLAHYGVKGMQWGVRRKRKSTTDILEPTRKLSNDDLRKVVDRMRLEQQYSELAKGKKKPPIVDGHAFAKKTVDMAGTALAGAVVGIAGKQVARAIQQRRG